jgi:hypothetical protein
MGNDRLLEARPSPEEVRILQRAMNNVLEFVLAGDFDLVRGLGWHKLSPAPTVK